MKKLSYLLVTFLMFGLSLPFTAYAQGTLQSRLSGGVDLGFTRFPDSDIDLGTGLSLRAYGEYLFSPHLSFTILGGYMEFDEDVALGTGTFSTTEPTRFEEAYVTGGLRARFLPQGRFIPFVTGNAGIYNGHKETITLVTGEIADTTQTLKSNDFGFNVGGGFEYFLGRSVALNLQVLLHSIQGDIDEEILDITWGLRYIPIPASGGPRY